MAESIKKPAPLSLKPELEDTARRWEAYFAGDLIDRPLVQVTAPKDPVTGIPPMPSYRQKVFADLDVIIDQALLSAEATYWGGEAIPNVFLSFGPNETAVFCGAELAWDAENPDTNWAVPFVDDWKTALPLRLIDESPLWQRALALYRRASERLGGKLLLQPQDLHTNMDLLAAVRGTQQLCLDLVDIPEWIDRAILSARSIYPQFWRPIAEAGRMDEFGYYQELYSMESTVLVCCDFIYLISPAMFRRWILPALEEEAANVRYAFFHWDGPGALVHAPDILACSGLHTINYVPHPDRQNPLDYIPLYQRIQAAGKGVLVGGTPEQLKRLHRELKPEKTIYRTHVSSTEEGERLLEWFCEHT